MINEALMKPGGWNLRLRPGTPKSVRDLLRLEVAGFSHIVITPVRIPDPTITTARLLATARYTGVLRGRPSEFEIGGPGPIFWIGDEDGKSSTVGTNAAPVTISAATFQSCVSTLRPAALTAGAVEAAGGSYSNIFKYTNRRAALETVMSYFNREYRVNPDLTLDAGSITNLYPTATTPTAIIHKFTGGRDLSISGVRATQLDTVKDLDDYATGVIVLGPNSAGVATVASGFKDLQGNLITVEKVLTSSEAADGTEASLATTEIASHWIINKSVKISSDAYDIGSDVRVGDVVHVWDPDLDIYDLTNPQQYRGEVVYPAKLRVFGLSWPVVQGMGVYLRDGPTGAITDLSEYIEWDTGDTTLDVGGRPRPLVPESSTPGTLALPPGVLPLAWDTYLPLLVQNVSIARTVNTARFVEIGKTTTAVVKVTATAAGSINQTFVQLPTPANIADVPIGFATWFDASVGNPALAMVYGYAGDLNYCYFIVHGSVGNAALNTALANGDVLFIHLHYERQ